MLNRHTHTQFSLLFLSYNFYERHYFLNTATSGMMEKSWTGACRTSEVPEHNHISDIGIRCVENAVGIDVDTVTCKVIRKCGTGHVACPSPRMKY